MATLIYVNLPTQIISPLLFTIELLLISMSRHNFLTKFKNFVEMILGAQGHLTFSKI